MWPRRNSFLVQESEHYNGFVKRDIQRLLGWLDRYEKRYVSSPRLWQRLIEQHQRGKEERPHWCFLTMQEVTKIQMAIFEEMGLLEEIVEYGMTTHALFDFEMIAALGAWQVTRGYYKYDETLLEALWNTPPLKGDLPAEMLKELPEWCVYIELPKGTRYLGKQLFGFWANVDQNPKGYDELRLMSDMELHQDYEILDAMAITIPMVGTLKEGIDMLCRDHLDSSLRDEIFDISSRAISVLLYLCDPDADYDSAKPSPITPKQVKRAMYPRKKSEQIYRIGNSIGAGIRQAKANKGSGADKQGGEKSYHIRGHHWHTYWIGKKGNQRPVPRFLAATEVRPDKIGKTKLTTVRKVR